LDNFISNDLEYLITVGNVKQAVHCT